MRKMLTALASIGLCAAVQAADPAFTLDSPDLPAGKPIPEQFTANIWGCHGPNVSPTLRWLNPPAGTKSFAITMFDSYTPPASGWWHWVVYDIPATVTELPRNAGAAGSTSMPKGARQGKPDGDAPEAHFYGSCPAAGDPPHHYIFTVYALSVDHLGVSATSTAANIDAEIADKIIGKASFERLFARPKAAH